MVNRVLCYGCGLTDVENEHTNVFVEVLMITAVVIVSVPMD